MVNFFFSKYTCDECIDQLVIGTNKFTKKCNLGFFIEISNILNSPKNCLCDTSTNQGFLNRYSLRCPYYTDYLIDTVANKNTFQYV